MASGASAKRVGVLGGGQLGRMMGEAASCIGIRMNVVDPTPGCPAAALSEKHIEGDFKDAEMIKKLAEVSDVLTCEIEHINVDALEEVAKNNPNLIIEPTPSTVRLIQDKANQKMHLEGKGLPIPEFKIVRNETDIINAGGEFGYPLMLKSRKMAYDGRGNYVIKSPDDIIEAMKALKGDLYVEKWAPFTKELAVMVGRSIDGTVVSYPVVETIQQNSICKTVIAPAQISLDVRKRAEELAERTITTFPGAGVYGVEMFLLEDDSILVNEIAPRPHNSGHYTIEACVTSQFEQHLRCVMGLPLGSTEMTVGAAVMVNILGAGDGEAGVLETWKSFETALNVKGASLHWYNKKGCKVGRKMGHITIVGTTMSDVLAKARSIDSSVSVSNDKVLPLVSVIMGSDSDLPTMKTAGEILRQFSVPFELTIVSAHRTPQRMYDFAKKAHLRGIKVIIAAAGGAAHLPGMVAALTPLPVIGCPIPLRYLDGQDSLYSICQMPRGVPVATVAIGNSTNAALLAVRILGSEFPMYQQKMLEYQESMEKGVYDKVDKLNSVGWENYN